MYNPREMLAQAGYIDDFEERRKRHAEKLLGIPCKTCGGAKPPEFKASALCPACLTVEMVEDGCPSEEVARMIAGIMG